MKKLHPILTILCLAILSACTEQPEPIPYTYTQVFTGTEKKGWTVRSAQLREPGKGPVPITFGDCVNDDVYIFFANEERRFEVREGDEKCSPDDPDLIAEGTWAFSNSGATMTIPFPPLTSGLLPFTVMSAEEDRMTLEFFLDDGQSLRLNFRTVELE